MIALYFDCYYLKFKKRDELVADQLAMELDQQYSWAWFWSLLYQLTHIQRVVYPSTLDPLSGSHIKIR